jgi:A/G-specific adenine glycosylase
VEAAAATTDAVASRSLARMTLGEWYAEHGRHELPWRAVTDRWTVLVAEVMLHQTQVARVLQQWEPFLARFPTPEATAAAAPGDVISQWGSLGYPRRARRLWESATRIAANGWPDDLTELPGVGRYTAAAVRIQTEAEAEPTGGEAELGASRRRADDTDDVAVDVNVGRVVQRVVGRRLPARAAEDAAVAVAEPLRGRDRLLALMDLGAMVCRPRDPSCDTCPLAGRCASKGPIPDESPSRQAPFAGSFRQRRGRVLDTLRSGDAAVSELDAEALGSLVTDGLAEISGRRAHLPGLQPVREGSSAGGRARRR